MKSYARAGSKIAVVLIGLFSATMVNAGPPSGMANVLPTRGDITLPLPRCTGTTRVGSCTTYNKQRCEDSYHMVGGQYYQCKFGAGACTTSVICEMR